MGAIVERSIPGPAGALPIRVYTPGTPGPHPLLMLFHGALTEPHADPAGPRRGRLLASVLFCMPYYWYRNECSN